MNSNVHTDGKPLRVVVVGGGFGGLYAVKQLSRLPVEITLVDKRNFHLFQPLLYQVATGGLSPGEIASPLRAVFTRQRNVKVLHAEVVDMDVSRRRVRLTDGEIEFDILILATGVRHHYFGHPQWESLAPGLKTIEDALEMRRRIFLAFEMAEKQSDPQQREAWMSFVIVGGGPTGVELAGALGELAQTTLVGDFREIDTSKSKIVLVEGLDRVLPAFPPELSRKAAEVLQRLGVTIRTCSMVTDLAADRITIRSGGRDEELRARTVLWSAGVQASPLGAVLARQTGAEQDRLGRIVVEPDLSAKGYPHIFIIGDLAHYAHQNGQPLPGVAPVAIQQGRYVARLIGARLNGKTVPPFRYRDKGSLAVIGRNAAVADMGPLHFNGFFAWLTWVFVHIGYLIEFDNKMLVLFQWAWNYVTRNRGARLITGEDDGRRVAG